MNRAADAYEKAVNRAHQGPGWIDFAAAVVAVSLAICAFSYLARQGKLDDAWRAVGSKVAP